MAIHISDLGNGHKIIENDEEYEKRTKVGCGSVLVFLAIVIGIALFNDDKKSEEQEKTAIKSSVSVATSSNKSTTSKSNNSVNERINYQTTDNDSHGLLETDVEQNPGLVNIDETSTSSIHDKNKLVEIMASDLRLRLNPSTDAETFKWGDGSNRHPKKGERFQYLGETRDFYKIDFHGNELWVSKQYTSIVDNGNRTAQNDSFSVEVAQKENSDIQKESLTEEFPINETQRKDIFQVLNLWTLYHNIKDIKSLCSLYADKVYYYQSDYSKEQVRDSKKKLVKKYPDFKQEISNVKIEPVSNHLKITFDKTVWTNTKEEAKVYPSYLYVKLIDGNWRIITESDLITDENLKKE